MRRINSKAVLHGLILGASLALTLSVRASLKGRYTAERYRIELEARAQRTAQIASQWNKLTFTDVSAADFTERFLSLTNWNSLRLDDRQQERLRERLPEVIAYWREPSMTEYLRLKTNGLLAKFELSSVVTQFLAQARVKLPLNGTAPEEAVDKLWRLTVIGTNADASPSRITAICLDRVKVALSHSNSAASVFNGPVRQGFAMLKEPINPGFYYGPQSKSNTGKATEPDLFFFLSFFAHSNTSTNASPVYLSLYWSAADQQWALDRLFTDAVLNFSALF